MMVTGDYHLTAVAVARGVGMVKPDTQVVIIQSKAEMHALQAYTKPITSALKQQSHTPHRHRSVSFRMRNNVMFEAQSTSLTTEQSSSEQGCEDLRFSLCTGDAYQGSDGLSTLASIAQVGKLHSQMSELTRSHAPACLAFEHREPLPLSSNRACPPLLSITHASTLYPRLFVSARSNLNAILQS